jgi:hypothetical protein
VNFRINSGVEKEKIETKYPYFILIVLACQRRKSALNTLLIPYLRKFWVFLKRWDFLRMITFCCKGFDRRRICPKLVRNGTVWEITHVMRKLTVFLVFLPNTNTLSLQLPALPFNFRATERDGNMDYEV